LNAKARRRKGAKTKAEIGKAKSRNGLRLASLQCYSQESCNSNKIFAAKERKDRKDKDLCPFFFAIYAFFCGQFVFGCGSAALRLGDFALKKSFISVNLSRQIRNRDGSIPLVRLAALCSLAVKSAIRNPHIRNAACASSRMRPLTVPSCLMLSI